MFDREIVETVRIAANPAEVWYHLANFRSYSEWNPSIRRINGELRVGARQDADGLAAGGGIPPARARGRARA